MSEEQLSLMIDQMKHLDFDSIMKQPSDSNILVNTSTSQKDPANNSRIDQELQKPSMSRRSSLSSRLSQLQDKEEEIKKKLADFDKRFGSRPPQIPTSQPPATNSPAPLSGFEFSEIPKITETSYDNKRQYTDDYDIDSDGANELPQSITQGQKFSQQIIPKKTNGPVYTGGLNPSNKKYRPERLDKVFEQVTEGNQDFRNRDSANFGKDRDTGKPGKGKPGKGRDYNNDEPIELGDEDQESGTVKTEGSTTGNRSNQNKYFTGNPSYAHGAPNYGPIGMDRQNPNEEDLYQKIPQNKYSKLPAPQQQSPSMYKHYNYLTNREQNDNSVGQNPGAKPQNPKKFSNQKEGLKLRDQVRNTADFNYNINQGFQGPTENDNEDPQEDYGEDTGEGYGEDQGAYEEESGEGYGEDQESPQGENYEQYSEAGPDEGGRHFS